MVGKLELRERPLAPKAWQEPQSKPDWEPSHGSEHSHDLPSAVDVEREWLREEVLEWLEQERAEAKWLVWKLLRVRRTDTDLTTLEEVLRVFWEHREQERAMARLEDAAKKKDEHAFLEALKGIEWQNRPPADFVRAARLALKTGAYAVAHQISVEGTKHYPDDPEIRKYARVLAPPETRIGKPISDSKHWANREWLKDHGSEYSGQWVAVRDGKLLGAAGSLKELARRVGDTKDVLLTKAL